MCEISEKVIQELIFLRCTEFVICPGARNAPFANLISKSNLNSYYFPEERSAAFFALGKARALNRPVAIITTSGSAVAETMPAVMEAYYTSVPLIVVSADRPKRYRGTGAPQAVLQDKIFGPYTSYSFDIDSKYFTFQNLWDQRAPLHINVCLEEPAKDEIKPSFTLEIKDKIKTIKGDSALFFEFLEEAQNPLVIVSTLEEYERKSVKQALLELNLPVFLEATSNLRGDGDLDSLKIYNPNPSNFDAFLRIGGVPTHRLWRDIENRKVLSISKNPFSGIPGGELIHTDLRCFFSDLSLTRFRRDDLLLDDSIEYQNDLLNLLKEYPVSEPSMILALANMIPEDALVYLGNSLPIREWDLSVYSSHEVKASRGVNGIDGQLSTFFGLMEKGRKNVCIIGDLTALYDLAAPWALKWLSEYDFAIVIINNGGGKIFKSMFPNVDIQNRHNLSFESFAKFWGLPYCKIESDVDFSKINLRGVLEIIPDPVATDAFQKKFKLINDLKKVS